MNILLITSTQLTGIVVLVAVLLAFSGSKMGRRLKAVQPKNLKVDFIQEAADLKAKINRARTASLVDFYGQEVSELSEKYWRHVPGTLLNDKIGDLYATMTSKKCSLTPMERQASKNSQRTVTH